MLRMLFEKTGRGIWISHLDLMRVFQRAFRRAGILIKHTQGYNPHAFVSIVLPLSVGTASRCELLEFDMDSEEPLDTLPEKLNAVLPGGVRCIRAYEGGRKIRDLACLRVRVTLEYDRGIPENAEKVLTEFFARPEILVEKKSKKGLVDQDIRPMIRELSVTPADENTLVLDAVICAQNPSLNPDQLARAIEKYLPDFAPDFAKSERLEVYDAQMEVFR